MRVGLLAGYLLDQGNISVFDSVSLKHVELMWN